MNAAAADTGERPFRLGVLVSGSGSNLQSIIDKLHHSSANIEIALVVSDNHKAQGLTRAAEAGISPAVFPMIDFAERLEHDLAMAPGRQRHEGELLVRAGLRVLGAPALLDR